MMWHERVKYNFWTVVKNVAERNGMRRLARIARRKRYV